MAQTSGMLASQRTKPSEQNAETGVSIGEVETACVGQSLAYGTTEGRVTMRTMGSATSARHAEQSRGKISSGAYGRLLHTVKAWSRIPSELPERRGNNDSETA